MFTANHSLKELNTFSMDVSAKQFAAFNSVEKLKTLLAAISESDETLFLGGGSNILFTQDYNGYVLKNEIKGIELVQETEQSFILKIGAGEVWHDFVIHSLDQGWYGLENMSLIPGTVGAAPIQNIGAYGRELKDFFISLEAFEISTGKTSTFNAAACEFGYRNSFFKNAGKGKYVITSVTLELSKTPTTHTTYGDITKVLEEKGISSPRPKDISNAVIQIRQSKLPDPSEIGNGGSFFKNPEVPTTFYTERKEKFPEMPGYKVSETVTKIPAGWLIDQAGWKGFTDGEIGVHKNQALVLVNYGTGKGNDIKGLAYKIKADVFEKFGVEIVPEVNII